mgnify:CR=1 FL=1
MLAWLRSLARFRLIFASLALALSELLIGYLIGGVVNWVLYDYLVWLISLAASLGDILDFLCFYRRMGYASTLTLDVLSLVLVAIGRLGSLALSMVDTMFTTPLVGGGIVGIKALRIASLVVPGSLIGFVVIALHTLAREPVVFVESRSWAEILHGIRRRLVSVGYFFEDHPIFTAFLSGFSLRFIPEVVWWPWHIGWDTVEYTAHLADFLTSLNPFKPYYWMGGLRNIPPLLDLILALPAAVVGPWLTFKLYPPIAFGVLVAAATYLAKSVLRVSPRNLVAVAFASALYILNLRISWDYQRQLLGSVVMILAIVLLESYRDKGTRYILLASLLLVLASMAHEVTGVVAFVLALLLLMEAIINRTGREIAVYSTTLAVITAFLLWYWRAPYTSNGYLGAAPPGIVAYPMYITTAGEVVSYLVVGYGLIIPPALLALAKPGYKYLKAALATLFLAGLSPLVAPYTATTTWYRFLIGVAPLMVPLAVAGLTTYGRDRVIAIYVLLFAVLVSRLHFNPCI